MVIAQVYLRLAAVKGHSKMYSFTVFGGLRKSVSIWCDYRLPHAMQHFCFIELLRLLIVGCGVLVHSSSKGVRSFLILVATGTRCRIRRSRNSQTFSMGTGMFSASRNCAQILATWVRELSCCNMKWWLGMNGTTTGLKISSLYLCPFRMPHTTTPLPPRGTRSDLPCCCCT